MSRIENDQLRVAVLVLTAILAQGCDKNYGIQTSGQSTNASTASSGAGGGGGGGTITTIQKIKPVFAIRGMNCIACHGVINSNVITDFGYGSPNFITNENFFLSGDRTAWNDTNNTVNQIGGWQTLSINGTVYVPNPTTPFSSSQSNTMFGSTSISDFASLLNYSVPGTAPNNGPMVPSTQTVSTYDNITISYPSQAEILALLPGQSANVAVSAINVPSVGIPTTMTGLGVDTSGNFVRNNGAVVCKGDVVVAGPLFLNNLTLTTDANGCRLYVSQTVFIQGPITYTGATNLQITSATAIMMGFSAVRMGYSGNLPPWTASHPVRVVNSAALRTSPGGPWPRFQSVFDSSYNPSAAPINGVASATYFDGLVSDAVSIGAELLDAGDPGAVNNLVTGETVINEPSSGDNDNDGGPRLAINYSGLLLNAPHIHSRYFGSMSGVMIGDIAFLARNPSSTQIYESFSFDPTFSNVNYILPALTTTILDVK